MLSPHPPLYVSTFIGDRVSDAKAGARPVQRQGAGERAAGADGGHGVGGQGQPGDFEAPWDGDGRPLRPSGELGRAVFSFVRVVVLCGFS